MPINPSVLAQLSLYAVDLNVIDYLVKEGGALDWDQCPACWEKFAHLQRYVFACKVYRHMRIIDFGCGVGYGSWLLSQYPAHNAVLGVDSSVEALSIARARRPGIRFAQEIPEAESFDGVVAFEVIEHLDNPRTFLATLKARHIVCSVPVVPTVGINPYHLHDFTVASFHAMIEERFTIRSSWLQMRPFTSEPCYAIVHGERKLNPLAKFEELK